MEEKRRLGCLPPFFRLGAADSLVRIQSRLLQLLGRACLAWPDEPSAAALAAKRKNNSLALVPPDAPCTSGAPATRVSACWKGEEEGATSSDRCPEGEVRRTGYRSQLLSLSAQRHGRRASHASGRGRGSGGLESRTAALGATVASINRLIPQSQTKTIGRSETGSARAASPHAARPARGGSPPAPAPPAAPAADELGKVRLRSLQ